MRAVQQIISAMAASAKVLFLDMFSPCYPYNITAYVIPSRTKNVRFQFNLTIFPIAQKTFFVGSSVKAIKT